LYSNCFRNLFSYLTTTNHSKSSTSFWLTLVIVFAIVVSAIATDKTVAFLTDKTNNNNNYDTHN